MDILIIGVNSNSDIIENLKISTTPFSYLKAVKNLSYAQILNQIAHFDHNFMTVDAIGFKICRTTGQTKPENIAPKYRMFDKKIQQNGFVLEPFWPKGHGLMENSQISLLAIIYSWSLIIDCFAPNNTTKK